MVSKASHCSIGLWWNGMYLEIIWYRLFPVLKYGIQTKMSPFCLWHFQRHLFLAVTKQPYDWFSLSVHPSVPLSIWLSHYFYHSHHCIIIKYMDCNSSLNSHMSTKSCTKLALSQKRCPMFFQGYLSNFQLLIFVVPIVFVHRHWKAEKYFGLAESQLKEESSSFFLWCSYKNKCQ